MRAQTLYSIVEHITDVSKATGIRPQQMNFSIKGLSEKTGIHRDTIRAALNNEDLGFKKTPNSAWRLGKEYKWEDFKAVYSILPDDVSKVVYWSQLPDFNWDEAGYQTILTKEERIGLRAVRKALEAGIKAEDIRINGAPVGAAKPPTKTPTKTEELPPILADLLTRHHKWKEEWKTQEHRDMLDQYQEALQDAISKKQWDGVLIVAFAIRNITAKN